MLYYEYYIKLYKQSKNNQDFLNLLKSEKNKITNMDETILTHQDYNTDLLIITDEEELTHKLLNNNLVTVRFGCVESSFYLKYKYNIDIIFDHHDYINNDIDYYIKKHTGLYYKNPNDKDFILEYVCNHFTELINYKNLTLTSCYLTSYFDLVLYSYKNIQKQNIHNWVFLNKILLTNLENKNILVLSNGVDIFKKTYNIGLQHFYNIEICNFNKINFIKTPQTTIGQDYPHDNIIETVNEILTEIDNFYYDFDVILLACGIYGPIITNLLLKKYNNKNILYLGSSLYTFFGTYTHSIKKPYDSIYNIDNFIEVDIECPPNCKDIDFGKYWKI